MRDCSPIAGAVEAVRALHAALRGPHRLRLRAPTASRSSCSWRSAACCRYFEGRIFSGHEMPRSKPAPDVYLAAAAALGVDPRRCAVVEDTVTGVTAGVAAGATVFGYSPPEAGHDAPGRCAPRAPRASSRHAETARACWPA